MKYFAKAILIIHGFSGDFSDNEFLANKLQLDSEFDVYSITLPGHDKVVLKDVTYDEWVTEAKNMCEHLLRHYSNLYLVGHSMGGVIASYLATQYNIKKLVLLAPAFEYFNFDQIKEDITDVKGFIKTYKDKENVNAYQVILSKLLVVPMKTKNEFTKLVIEYKGSIANVTCPVLFLHGTIDEVVPISSSYYGFYTTASKQKYFGKVNGARHALIKSSKKKEVINCTYRFLKGGNKWKEKKIFEI